MWTSLGLLIAGFVAVIAMKDDNGSEEIKYVPHDNVYYGPDDDYEKLTYDYFMGLRLDEQERYYKENLDLRYYKDNPDIGLTNDRYLNAKHAKEISRMTGKQFTNKYKTY